MRHSQHPPTARNTQEGAWSVLRDYLVPILLEAARSDDSMVPESGALWDLFGSIRGHAMAKACLEMAVLDAGLRSTQSSFADLIGVTRDRVEAGAVVGLATSDSEVSDLCRKVEALVSEGYPRVKVKIAPGSDFGALERAASRLPPARHPSGRKRCIPAR